jgi:hypothetical protein
MKAMKFKILLVVAMLLLSAHLFSQVKFGVRAGISSSSIKSDDITSGNVTVKSVSNAMVGYHFGFVGRITILSFFLQPELLFSHSGGQLRLIDTDKNLNEIIDQKFNRLDLPVIVGKKLGPIRFGLGPVFSSILSSNSDLADFGTYSDEFNKATVGYQLDLGLDISKIALDLKYEGNLSKLGNGITIGGTQKSFDSRARQFIFSVGYFF